MIGAVRNRTNILQVIFVYPHQQTT